MKLFPALPGFIVCALLAGCAGYSPGPQVIGKDQAFVVTLMGEPAARQSLSGGYRLVYPRGPYGRHTYFVDLNEQGRVIQWEQVLTEENFKRIEPGNTQAAVEALIGPSFIKSQLARNRGEVWAYRFETPFCIWFEIEFSAQGLVRSAGHGFPPECLRLDAQAAKSLS
jgi:hypothetical protein